jgi:hypothetical protein
MFAVSSPYSEIIAQKIEVKLMTIMFPYRVSFLLKKVMRRIEKKKLTAVADSHTTAGQAGQIRSDF